MTLYTRPKNEVFASDSPPSEIKPFDAWAYGLGIAFIETSGFPELESMNGLFNALNQYIKYLEQNGFAEWSSALEYPVGAGVRVGSTWYRARTRNTNKPPATSQNDWALFLNGADVASASTSVKGIVQLNNTLNSTSTTQALTAAQGKALQDNKFDKAGGVVSGSIDVNGVAKIRSYLDIGLGYPDSNKGITFYNQDGGTTGAIRSTSTGRMQFESATAYSFDKIVDANISGNAASASNVSRSIVAGNGLSGGGELNANRTLTLGTPGTVTASTTNSTTSTSHTHNLDVNSLPLLGMGQTWQNVTSSRSGGVTYTNNTGRPIQVLINANLNNGSLVLGGVTIPINDSEFYSQPSFIIPNGSSYRVNVGAGGSILTWAELR